MALTCLPMLMATSSSALRNNAPGNDAGMKARYRETVTTLTMNSADADYPGIMRSRKRLARSIPLIR
jgi:hypothetical protein